MVLAWAAALCAVEACERQPQAPQAASRTVPSGADAQAAAASPTECARRLHGLHLRGAYTQMATLIVEQRRAATVEFIKAVDQVLAVNDRLREAAVLRFGGLLPRTWDLGVMKNNLGVFSHQVTFIGEKVRGDEAVVTLQEGEHVPLVHARFTRRGGAWRYRPDPVSAGMTGELRKLADILLRIHDGVERGLDFDSYADVFYFRVLPQVGRVMAAGQDPRRGRAGGPREIAAVKTAE